MDRRVLFRKSIYFTDLKLNQRTTREKFVKYTESFNKLN